MTGRDVDFRGELNDCAEFSYDAVRNCHEMAVIPCSVLVAEADGCQLERRQRCSVSTKESSISTLSFDSARDDGPSHVIGRNRVRGRRDISESARGKTKQ